MTTLTTNWQNVASYRFAPGTGFIVTFYLDAKYSSQSQANNTTTIQTRLNCTVNQGSGGGNGYKFTLSYGGTKQGSSYWTFATETITTGSATITHNNNGEKSISLSSYLYVGYTGLDHTMSTTVKLPTIKRASKIDSFSGNDLEGTFSATYTKYVSGWENRLRISIPGVKMLQTYYNYASGTGVSLNEESIDYIKTYMNTNHLPSVTLGGVIETWNGSTRIGDSSEIKNICQFINAEPTFTYTTKELNNKVIDIIGNSKATTIIQNVSQVKFAISPEAKKGSVISQVSGINSGQTKTATTLPYDLIFDSITDNKFNITVTDVRTLSAAQQVELQMINYESVVINNFNFERQNPTSSNLVLNADIKYYQQTFNQTVNVPTIQWQCVEEGQSLGTWNTISSRDYTVDKTNNKITITNLLLSNVLDYRKKGTLYLKINDLLTEFSNNMPVIKGIPVMDWGEHDVQINGDLFLADENRENTVNIRKLCQDIYSTEEQRIGTWIDGKPIYRVVKTFTNYNTLKQGTDIPCSIPNVETVTHQYYQYEYLDEKRVFPLLETSGNTLNICFQPIAQKLHCSGTGTWYARPLTAIIEYTKTTE